MKMAIEVFSLILVIAISCVLFSSMISMSVQNAEARDFYNIVRNRIEDSNYSSDVIEECILEAEEKGYKMTVKDVSVYSDIPSKLLRLEYKVVMPVYKLLHREIYREASVEGYAR